MHFRLLYIYLGQAETDIPFYSSRNPLVSIRTQEGAVEVRQHDARVAVSRPAFKQIELAILREARVCGFL